MKLFITLCLSLLFLCSCQPKIGDPVSKIIDAYGKYPQYSVQLKNMREDTEKKKFFHQYDIHVGKPMDIKNPKTLTFSTDTTKWIEVTKQHFDKYLPDLGMIVYSEENGKADSTPKPAGYKKVGNPQYGSWQTNSQGTSMWAFYGQYMFFSHLMGGSNVYRSDYNTYQNYNRSGRTYYGPVKNGASKYGTMGSSNKKSGFRQKLSKMNTNKRSSFKNRLATVKSKPRSFKARVSGASRIKRAKMNAVRSRSRRSGK